MNNCTPEELKKRIEEKSAPLLIDVREADEVEICRLPGARHVPVGEVPQREGELATHKDEEIIVYCHHGIRSASVQNFLLAQGFQNVRNLTGGIDAYSVEVDPSVPRY